MVTILRERHKRHWMPVSAPTLFILATFLFAVVNTTQADSISSRPPVDWSSKTLFIKAPIGTSFTVNVSGTIQSAIPSTTVSLSPSLVPFVRITPNTIPALPVGAQLELTLTVSVPSGTPPAVFDGTVHLRNGKLTIARPLPVTICAFVPPTVTLQARGLSLTYPSSWYLNHSILDLGGPISIDNHAGQHVEGGFSPAEGADIVIGNGALPQITIPQLIAKELAGTSIQDSTSISVGGEPGTRVAYSYDLSSASAEKAVAVYVSHGTQLYKFVLTYRASALGEANFLSTFSSILNSVQFQP